jgi:hypothetical protein
VTLGLTREPDDHVGADRRVRHPLADRVDERAIRSPSVYGRRMASSISSSRAAAAGGNAARDAATRPRDRRARGCSPSARASSRERARRLGQCASSRASDSSDVPSARSRPVRSEVDAGNRHLPISRVESARATASRNRAERLRAPRAARTRDDAVAAPLGHSRSARAASTPSVPRTPGSRPAAAWTVAAGKAARLWSDSSRARGRAPDRPLRMFGTMRATCGSGARIAGRTRGIAAR